MTEENLSGAARIPADRSRGAMLGLAVGDAMGAPVQFMAPGSFPEVTGYGQGGSFEMARGEWTDDTAMALCLAESLLACEGFDREDQMARYLGWLEAGRNSTRPYAFDIGNTVHRALTGFRRTGRFPRAPGNPARESGNGGIMRLAPAVLAWAHSPAHALRHALASSRVTHVSPQCDAACAVFANALLKALHGRDKQTVLELAVPVVPGALPDLDYGPVGHLLAGPDWRCPPFPIRGHGYVVQTLEAALWAFATTDTFAAGLLRAVNLGEDADTVGAVYGQLAGAWYGLQGIPADWRTDVFDGGRLLTVSDGLRRLAMDRIGGRETIRTSINAPLRIDALAYPRGEGRIGMSFCPGKRDPHGTAGHWQRHLDTDLEEIVHWGARVLVCLVEAHELAFLGVAGLAAKCARHGLRFLHCPIPDQRAPDARFEPRWAEAWPTLQKLLEDGGRVFVHCRGGLGRTGLVAARMLIDAGLPPDEAIRRVRAARRRTIETREQELYLEERRWLGAVTAEPGA